MTPQQLTNVLIGLLIAIIGYIGKMLIGKIDKFEQTVQGILMSDVSNKKDIERLKDDITDHEVRIVRLEK
jgi:hypothetical protein